MFSKIFCNRLNFKCQIDKCWKRIKYLKYTYIQTYLNEKFILLYTFHIFLEYIKLEIFQLIHQDTNKMQLQAQIYDADSYCHNKFICTDVYDIVSRWMVF